MHLRSNFLSRGLVLIVLAGASGLAADAQIPTRRPADPAPQTVPPKPPQKTPEKAPEPGRDETFPNLQRQLADALKQRDMSRALAVALRQHALFPAELKASADLGEVYMARGEADRAEPVLLAAVGQRSQLYSGNAAALLGGVYANLGKIALDKGRTREAIGHLQRAVDYAPAITRARFMLAWAFAKAGDNDRANREIKAAFDVDSESARAPDYLLLSRALRGSGNANGAADALANAVKLFPLDVDLRYELAVVRRAQKRPADAVYELLYVRMLLEPGAPQAEAVAKQLDELRAQAEAATPDPPPELEAIFSYLDDAATDQHEQAIATIHDVIQMNGHEPFVPRLLLAQSCVATGRLAEAERVYTSLVGEDPSSVPALAGLAELYFMEGREEAGGRTLARALALDPANPVAREVEEAWKAE